MHPDFNLPQGDRIDGRSTTIRAAFFKSITPVIRPPDADVDKALAVLGMSKGNCVCAYCGDAKSEWDHFRPIVTKEDPTGYITEIQNLVPSCGKCNQSKGNKNWKEWMNSGAKKSPKTRGVKDLAKRIAALEKYEQSFIPSKIDYKSIVGHGEWDAYIKSLQSVIAGLQAAQITAGVLRKKIDEFVKQNAVANPPFSLDASPNGDAPVS